MPIYKKITFIKMTALLILIIFFHDSSFGWHDETHLSVAKAAGYSKWYHAVGADITKIKAGRIEKNNHYYNNSPKVPPSKF